MPTDNQIAEQIATAIQQADDVLGKVQDLHDEIGAFSKPRAYMINGTSYVLVVRPGWSPLRPVGDYVFLAERLQ